MHMLSSYADVLVLVCKRNARPAARARRSVFGKAAAPSCRFYAQDAVNGVAVTHNLDSCNKVQSFFFPLLLATLVDPLGLFFFAAVPLRPGGSRRSVATKTNVVSMGTLSLMTPRRQLLRVSDAPGQRHVRGRPGMLIRRTSATDWATDGPLDQTSSPASGCTESAVRTEQYSRNAAAQYLRARGPAAWTEHAVCTYRTSLCVSVRHSLAWPVRGSARVQQSLPSPRLTGGASSGG
ncbi:hypothetical protein M441DRAFT_397280 [Trichoderma asperellum CBS 433.97]|uniref:Uncharacterized protein n=1 Tax=Trichoderma asperellum (strain ATCC 204424 / CBS 433.97 / NBRC 101777) TaxID=1042311 RepID=A0A2T3Z977_TRIA4|nr:hypothetical protein M441DRAFT_397280 [Trichoderma asperellum CBS 433.97]PTB41364.1 hypothetical protein M441DRAFT_397280 [Trichoderma asperellum CBS 433.97]WVH32620.1 hypothetical protein [Trichoderma asperellum]